MTGSCGQTPGKGPREARRKPTHPFADKGKLPGSLTGNGKSSPAAAGVVVANALTTSVAQQPEGGLTVLLLP